MKNWLYNYKEEISNCKTKILYLGPIENICDLLDYNSNIIPCVKSYQEYIEIQNSFKDIKLFDMEYGLPFEEGSFDIIVADSSLHFFDDNTTKKLLFKIKRILKQNGILIFRVNSDKVNEDNIKCFSKEDIYHYFGNGILEYLEEENVNQKILWKGCIRY